MEGVNELAAGEGLGRILTHSPFIPHGPALRENDHKETEGHFSVAHIGKGINTLRSLPVWLPNDKQHVSTRKRKIGQNKDV